jgi:hypothetical protein
VCIFSFLVRCTPFSGSGRKYYGGCSLMLEEGRWDGTAPDNLRCERGERSDIELGEILRQQAASDFFLLLLFALAALLLLQLLLRRRVFSLSRLPLHFLLSLHPQTHASMSRALHCRQAHCMPPPALNADPARPAPQHTRRQRALARALV